MDDEQILETPIAEIGMSVRLTDKLEQADVFTIGELLRRRSEFESSNEAVKAIMLIESAIADRARKS